MLDTALFAIMSVLIILELLLFFYLGFITGKSHKIDTLYLGLASFLVVLSALASGFLYVEKHDTELLPMAAIALTWAVGLGVGRIFRSPA